MRWRRRDEPLASHHVEARAPKWDISSGLTEEDGPGPPASRGEDAVVVVCHRRSRAALLWAGRIRTLLPARRSAAGRGGGIPPALAVESVWSRMRVFAEARRILDRLRMPVPDVGKARRYFAVSTS